MSDSDVVFTCYHPSSGPTVGLGLQTRHLHHFAGNVFVLVDLREMGSDQENLLFLGLRINIS